MPYKLSIITINLNNSSGLNKTCLSVITQTFRKFEWIIIDGGSVDNSVDIIKHYSDYIAYWISESDSGVYNAMNKGIKNATGEYLLFLNSGDYLLHPWTLQEAIDEVKTTQNVDVYYSDAVLNTYQLRKSPQEITLNFFIKGMINHQNCIIKRELFNHRLYDENYQIVADWYFFLQELINYKITFLHIKTNIAIFDTSGISNNTTEKYFAERHYILKKLNIGNETEIGFLACRILRKIKNKLPYRLFKLIKLFRNFLYD
jgi:glycosyltransferase involved in cell wall biosynthesis